MSRTGLLKGVLMSLGLLILGALWFGARHATGPATTMLWMSPLLALAWSTKLPLVLHGVAVEFTEEGLIDRTTGLGFVSWSEIVAVRRRVHWFGDFVELGLKDRSAFIARQPWHRAWVLKSNLRNGLPGPSINAAWVAGGAEAVLESLGTRVRIEEG